MQSALLNGMKKRLNITETENGAVALDSTLNACVDLFGFIGAAKDADEKDILSRFYKAFNEDPELAMRILFWSRDARGGQGLRRPFRIIVKDLAEMHPEFIENNFDCFVEYGRFDDFLCLLDTNLASSVAIYLYFIIRTKGSTSLCAKWLPSENASSKETRRYAKHLMKLWKMSPRQYRKLLSALRAELNIVERKVSAKDWHNINYDTVPGHAAMKYFNAFLRHDEARYLAYIDEAAKDPKKLKTETLFPVNLVHKLESTKHFLLKYKTPYEKYYNLLWKHLPDYFDGNEMSYLCMVDTSGSMWGTPYEVAVSLGIYCAERCKGPFYRHFITFAHTPTLEALIGDKLSDYLKNIGCINAGNTNIEAAFELILNAAIENHLSQSDLPKKLIIISDMQFDQATHGWNRGRVNNPVIMQQIMNRFAEAGYEMPELVYWNVRASKSGMFQTEYNGIGCSVVSGYSPSIFKALISQDQKVAASNGKLEVTPLSTMMEVLYGTDRYDLVWPCNSIG